ncbi:hypothetical protein ABAC402_12635 [Asticcacaulis sp. AC402]|nr:hypothetical protein ABAC402_12635 [Asticcacaulis sp. AC402]
MVLAAVLATAAIQTPAMAEPLAAPATDSGVIRIQSAYSVDETVARIKADVAAKGIKFFSEIDQSALAKGAGIALPRSTLVQFGNPPLGIQFLTASPYSGLDWPVRMLVLQDNDGNVWVAWTDFDYIAHRHHITDRDAQFKMASEVAASIASSARAK